MGTRAYAEKPDTSNCLHPGQDIAADAGADASVPSARIRIEVRHSKGVIVVSWPAENAAAFNGLTFAN